MLPWLILVPQLMASARTSLVERRSLSLPHLLLLALGISSLTVVLLLGLWPPWSALFFVVLWAVAEAGRAAWQHSARQGPSLPLQLGEPGSA